MAVVYYSTLELTDTRKRRNMTLDHIDLRIINHLTQDGRSSGEKIAHDLAIDEGTCRFRMRRLIGDLVHVKAFVNPAKVGFPVAAFLGFKVQPTEVASAVEQLAGHRRMVQVNSLTGMFDIIALAVFRSGRDVTSVMQELSEEVKGVRDIQAIMCLETNLGFYVRISPELLWEKQTKTDLDDIDKKMVACLIEDGRLNARDIARMLKIGEAPARRRLKQLLDNKVIAVSCVVDAASIGFPVVALVGFKVELPKIRDVASALANHPQINYVTTCAGAFDIIAAGMFRSTTDLLKTLQTFVSQIAGIKDTHTFVCFGESTNRSQWVPRGLVLAPEDQAADHSAVLPLQPDTSVQERRKGKNKGGQGPDWKQILEGKSHQEQLVAVAENKGGKVKLADASDLFYSLGLIKSKSKANARNTVQGLARNMVDAKVFQRIGRGEYRLLGQNGKRSLSD